MNVPRCETGYFLFQKKIAKTFGGIKISHTFASRMCFKSIIL